MLAHIFWSVTLEQKKLFMCIYSYKDFILDIKNLFLFFFRTKFKLIVKKKKTNRKQEFF